MPNGNEKVVLSWFSRAYRKRRIALTARFLDAVLSLSGITSPYENAESFFARLFRTTRRRGWYHSALFCPESSRMPAGREAGVRGEGSHNTAGVQDERKMHMIRRAFGASERRAHAAGIRSGRGAHNAAGVQGERKVRILRHSLEASEAHILWQTFRMGETLTLRQAFEIGETRIMRQGHTGEHYRRGSLNQKPSISSLKVR